MEILPTHGLGPLRFGMRPDEVRSLMGEAETYEDWMGGNLNDSILYHGLILGFDKCDAYGPLPDSSFVDAWIRGRPDVVLWGKPLSDWTKEDVEAHLLQRKITYEATKLFGINIPSLALGMNFEPDGRVESLDISRPARRGWAKRIVDAFRK